MRKGGSKWNERDMSRGRRGEGGVSKERKAYVSEAKGCVLRESTKKGLRGYSRLLARTSLEPII